MFTQVALYLTEFWRTWNTCLGAATKLDKYCANPASLGAKSKLCFGNNIT